MHLMRNTSLHRPRVVGWSLVELPASDIVDFEAVDADVVELVIAVTAQFQSGLAVALVSANSRQKIVHDHETFLCSAGQVAGNGVVVDCSG